MHRTLIFLLFWVAIANLFCCTVGVISGSVTVDGRPIIWKSREAGSNVQMMYEDSYPYKYIGSGNAGSEYVWMGINETGLAIANSVAGDLSRLPGNGDCMLQALRYYSTIEQFTAFLDSTNITGRETHTNYVMMDATGRAVLIEASANEYWLYEADETPHGYIVRDLLSFAGSGAGYITGRVELMQMLLNEMSAQGEISIENIFATVLTGFYDNENEPYAIPFPGRMSSSEPFGYINFENSNSGNSHTSVSLMHGVLPQEESFLTTMWTMLGTPAASIAMPYWAVCPAIPQPASGTPAVPLTDRAGQIKSIIYNTSPASRVDTYVLSNPEGTGYWDTIQPFQEEKFALINSLREIWVDNPPSIDVLQSYEDDICNEGYELVMNWDYELQVQAAFAADNTHGEIPFEVHFCDQSLHDPDSLAWDFDGDNIIDTLQTADLGNGVDWLYNDAGSYNVTLYAYKGSEIDTLTLQEYITASSFDTEYLHVNIDTLIFSAEEPFEQDFFLYNTGDYLVELQNLHFIPLPDYPSPDPELFCWEFTDENTELPFVLSAGDSLQIAVYPLMPVREYWGSMLCVEADIDSLYLPCLYDEELWQDGDEDQVPDTALKLSVYPNPFNPATTISFYLNTSVKVKLDVYNSKGQKIKSLVNGMLPSGKQIIHWDGVNEKGNSCSSGIYLIKLNTADSREKVSRCLLLK